MTKIVRLNWKPLDPPQDLVHKTYTEGLFKEGSRQDPYNGWPVTLYMNKEVFEAFWVDPDSEDYQPMLKSLYPFGYWVTRQNKIYPPLPCYATSIDVKPYRKGLVETSLKIQDGILKDKMVISGSIGVIGGWATVEYHDGLWTDIFGDSMVDNENFKGLVIELPRGFIPENVVIKGKTGLPWL